MRKNKAVKLIRQMAQRRRRMATPCERMRAHTPNTRIMWDGEVGIIPAAPLQEMVPVRISMYAASGEAPLYFPLPDTVPCSLCADHDPVQTKDGKVLKRCLVAHSTPQQVLDAAICRRCANAHLRHEVVPLKHYFDRAMDRAMDRAVRMGVVEAVAY